MTSRHIRLWVLLCFAVLLAAALYWPSAEPPPIRIGVLHSITGSMSKSERPLVDVLSLAFDEINASGGLLGRKITPVVVDCRSDWGFCAKEAERLITEEKVSALFGCWTSACRKAVKPVVERHKNLLFYPLQYEGMEQSPNIIYLGAAPNQQVIPAVRWALDHLGKRYYLVGSDYVFPHTANLIMKDLILSQGGQVLGERYIPLGNRNMSAVVDDIHRLQPDVILNTVNGDSNEALFGFLRAAERDGWHRVPIMSFSIAESELQAMPPGIAAGSYAAWNYFQSIATPENQAFVEKFRKHYGASRVVSDPMEASWIAVHLWQQAVVESGSIDPVTINQAILRQSMAAPSGIVSISPYNRHLWKTARIGQVKANGQFDIVWASTYPIRPEPYPTYRSRRQWDEMLETLK